MPIDAGKHATYHETKEGASEPGDHVEPHGHAPLVRREGVGQNGCGIGHQEGATSALDHPSRDQLDGSRSPGAGKKRQEYGGKREDEKAQVVHADPAEDIAQTPDGDHQNSRNQHVAHEGPKQEVGVGGLQGIDMDAAKDRRQ